MHHRSASIYVYERIGTQREAVHLGGAQRIPNGPHYLLHDLLRNNHLVVEN